MAQMWSNIIIQVLLKGNFIAGDPATVAANYATAGNLSDANITKAGAEYSFKAVVDGILEAMGYMIEAIGANRESEYRAWFADTTATIASGAAIPLTGATSKPRYGVASDFKDTADGTLLSIQPRNIVDIANKFWPRNKQEIYQCWTDDVSLVHTRPAGATASIVSWDRAAERAVMIATNNTSPCPLPDGLLPVLIFGALSEIFRDTFNAEQSSIFRQLFTQELLIISGKPPAVVQMQSKK